MTLKIPGRPAYELKQAKGLAFKLPQFSDLTLEFLVEDGHVKAIKQKDPSGEYTFPKN